MRREKRLVLLLSLVLGCALMVSCTATGLGSQNAVPTSRTARSRSPITRPRSPITPRATGSGSSPSGSQTNSSSASLSLTQIGENLTFQWAPAATTPVRFEIDDSPTFNKPVVSQTATGNALTLGSSSAGLAPGVTYYARIASLGLRTSFRIQTTRFMESALSYEYLRQAWNTSGRAWLTHFSGINWTEGGWQLASNWSDAPSMVAQDAYHLENATRSAVNMAAVNHDLALISELASFFNTYTGRFTTLGALRSQSSLDTHLLAEAGSNSALTLSWILNTSTGQQVVECDLCNSQFYHPVSRLLRVISMLPASERTSAMLAFVQTYTPMIVQDHLLRLLYSPKNFVAGWQSILNGTYNGIMSDRDAWLIAASAEVLGANANDPVLVPLTATQQQQLQDAVSVGVKLFQHSRTLYPDTKNFQGLVVGSASYFNGDLVKSPDLAYSGYTGEPFPTTADRIASPGASWDVSHFQRIPIFLRSLYDNRKATGVNFPSVDDVQLLVNQLMYRVFQGNFALPVFSNYFDGSDGWYRVGYYSPTFGYPRSQYCDNNNQNRPCLSIGAVQGWGLLSFFNSDLSRLQHSLVALEWNQDATAAAFKTRYFTYNGLTYSPTDIHGNAQYPVLSLFIMSSVTELLSDVK